MTELMCLTPITIADVSLIEPEVFGDERGFFMETWNVDHFAEDNYSHSRPLTLCWLHSHIYHPQVKRAQIVNGVVFDMVVDLRRSSSTFGRWMDEIFFADNKHQVWLSSGFSHGSYALSEDVYFLYNYNNFYLSADESYLLRDTLGMALERSLVGGKSPLLFTKKAATISFSTGDIYP